MTDSTVVTAVAPAPSRPEPSTRTARPADSGFLPVLRELSSPAPRDADSTKHAEGPDGSDDLDEAATPADDESAPERRSTTQGLEAVALLLALVPPSAPSASSADVPAALPAAALEGVVAATGAIISDARPALVRDATSVDVSSAGVATGKPPVAPDPALSADAGIRAADAPQMDDATSARSAAPAPAALETPLREATLQASAAVEGAEQVDPDVRNEGTRPTTTDAPSADLRMRSVLVQELAAVTANSESTAHDDGRDRGGDGDGTRQRADGTAIPTTGIAETRAAIAADTTQAPEPVVTPRAVVDQVAQRVLLISRDGQHEVSMRLEPPELGAVRIDAVLTGRQLTLHIRAEQEPTRDLLEQALPRLRESLAQHGIATDRVTVQVGLDSGPSDFGRHGGEAFRPMPPVTRGVAIPPRLVSAPSMWREAVTEGFEVWA